MTGLRTRMAAPAPRARTDFINSIISRPYKLGAQGPKAFDCYSLTRYVQKHLFGRDMPEFLTPETVGLQAIAGFIRAHPERSKWRPIDKPVDGAIVSMFRQGIGHHIGTYLDMDGGLILHAIEGSGVSAERLFMLASPPAKWTAFRYYTR